MSGDENVTIEEVRKYIGKRYERWLDYSTYHCAQQKMAGEEVDLLNEVLINLLEKPEEKLIELYSKKSKEYTELDFFILRMIKLNATSDTAPYRHRYKQIPTNENVHFSQLNVEDEEYEEDDRPAEILKQKQLVYDIVDKRLDLTYEQRDMFYFKFEGGDFSEWYGHEEYKQFQDNYYKVRNKIKDEIQKDKIKKTTMSVLRSVENEVRAIKDKKRLEIIKKQQDQGYFKTISTYTNLNDMDNKKEPNTVIISKKDLKELISEMIPTANKTETNIEVQSQKLINTEVLKALVFDVIKKELLSELSNLAIQTASEGLINKPSAIIMKNRLDTSEALKYLSERGFSISRSTLSKYSNNGTIVSTLKSNRRYFTTEDLDVFLKKMAA